MTTPTYILLLVSRLYPEMTTVDAVFARALLVLVVVEYFADQQQWDYHQAKTSYQKNAKVRCIVEQVPSSDILTVIVQRRYHKAGR